MRTYMTEFDKYKGLFAEQGDFDIPPALQAGFSWDATPSVTLLADWKRIWYSDVNSVGNPFLSPGPLGADDGAGFGWEDIDAFKFGIQWQTTPTIALRAGVGLNDNPILIPRDNALTRMRVKRWEALADGIMDAAVSARYETFLRPEALRWADWVDGQMGKVRRGLDVLEGEQLSGTVEIGTISIACALGYMDFRYPDEGWRDTRPGLAAWYEEMSARPSMTRTVPE